MEDLQNKFTNVPEDFITEYVSIIRSENITQYKGHSFKLMDTVGNYLGLKTQITDIISVEAPVKKIKPDYHQLAALYEEISSTFNKIYMSCESGNCSMTFLTAVSLQGDLDEAVEYGGRDYELLNHYRYTELNGFSGKVRDIELDFIQNITMGGGRIKKYRNFEEFEKAAL